MNYYPVGRGRFLSWLEGRGDEVVGRPMSEVECPLATYLRETTRRKFNVEGYALVEGEECWFLPSWAVRVVDQIDNNFWLGERITGRELLGRLDV